MDRETKGVVMITSWEVLLISAILSTALIITGSVRLGPIVAHHVRRQRAWHRVRHNRGTIWGKI